MQLKDLSAQLVYICT